jgi:hypothetical protein
MVSAATPGVDDNDEPVAQSQPQPFHRILKSSPLGQESGLSSMVIEVNGRNSSA